MEKQNFQEHFANRLAASLKKQRNHKGEVFLYLSKKSAETQPAFSTSSFFFQNKFSTWQIKLNIYIRKTNLFLIKVSIWFYLEMQRRFIETKLYKFFHFIWKGTAYKPSKVTATKKPFFPSVHVIATACFDEFFDSMW